MDWEAIKVEYITSNIGYRMLAQKYKVPFKTLAHRAKVEGWVSLRQQHKDNIVTQSVKKAAKAATGYRTTLYELAYKVANQIGDLTDDNSLTDLAVLGISPRQITGAIKDLEDILHIKSDVDIEEQQARIAKLQKEVADDNSKEDKTVRVVISGDAGSYSD